MRPGLRVGLDRDGAGPDLLRAHAGVVDGGLAVHAGRLGGVGVERVARDHPHAVVLPFRLVVGAHGAPVSLEGTRVNSRIVGSGAIARKAPARPFGVFARAEASSNLRGCAKRRKCPFAPPRRLLIDHARPAGPDVRPGRTSGESGRGMVRIR